MQKIQCELTADQAQVACDSLDLYTRLCIGQLEELTKLVRFGVIPMGRSGLSGEREIAPPEVCNQVDILVQEIKKVLGYQRNGGNGISHSHVHLSARRAYEIQKVLAKTTAEVRDPNPGFRNVDYDGLGPRYTNDPAPVAVSGNAWLLNESSRSALQQGG